METKIRRGELIMNTGNIVRISVEVDYYLSQICKRYKECTGNRLTKQDALLKLIPSSRLAAYQPKLKPFSTFNH